jgi:hypothetical protein
MKTYARCQTGMEDSQPNFRKYDYFRWGLETPFAVLDPANAQIVTAYPRELGWDVLRYCLGLGA